MPQLAYRHIQKGNVDTVKVCSAVYQMVFMNYGVYEFLWHVISDSICLLLRHVCAQNDIRWHVSEILALIMQFKKKRTDPATQYTSFNKPVHFIIL